MKNNITFVLPTWNAEFVLNQTLDSIFEQSNDDFTLIIVDDASTDATEQICRSIDDKRVIYIRNNERKGAGYSRNLGNSLAPKGLIIVTDCGDIYYPSKVSETLTFFDNNNIDIMCSAVDSLAGSPAIQPRLYNAQKGEKLGFEHPGVVYTTHVTDKIKYRETSIHTDQYDAFFFDCGIAGFKFGTYPKPLSSKCTFNKYTGGRDLDAALKVKLGIYKEYGIDPPEWLTKYETKGS